MAGEIEINVPDIGGVSGVEVIELLVKEGDVIQKDTPLVTLESDKASMEIPSPKEGVVRSLRMKIGDKVSEGDVILMLEVGEAAVPSTPDITPMKKETPVVMEPPAVIEPPVAPIAVKQETPLLLSESTPTLSAGPAARRLAHALGVSLANVPGSGRNARISKEDVEKFVKQTLNRATSSSGFSLPKAAEIDFSKWGDIETKPLNKIKRLTGVNVHRAWVTIPHVTQFDEADITDLDAFRQSESLRMKADGVKLTVLAFVCKVVSKALTVFPQFNASLDASGENLIYKHYCHIGIAVETPNGLVVPVIKDVNHLSVVEIAREMGRLSAKARDKGLMPADMSGGCFTISSLGGIGGTAFTPIVNSPEVAILGLSRASMKPVYESGVFVPRLMLPLSLSYDHRLIDGAEAARFSRFVADALSDIRRILL